MKENMFILATVSLAGFVLQRILELLDPILRAAAKWVEQLTEKCGNWKFTEKEAKTTILALLSVVLGIVVAHSANLHLPNPSISLLDNPWVLGLLIGSGTEGANILIKYFNYLKESRKRTAGL